jgi:[protein-PII] uridylyltransferase
VSFDAASFLRSARERVAAFHRATGASGTRIARLYTAAVDNTLRGAWQAAADGGAPAASGAAGSASYPPGLAQFLSREFCLVATGGYARKVLCPYSDVDVILLSSEPADEALAEAARALLYPLWDNKLAVGQHPGTVDEILARAEGQISTETALLDLRFIAGNRSLFEKFRKATGAALPRWQEGILERVREENLARFRRYGDSVFLLEPHVKEGKGGLRDFHWLSWIAKLRHGTLGDYDLLLSGVVEPEHYRALVEAYELLLRVRTQLHTLHGRAQDRLLFEAQEPVARALGFRAARKLLAVERFMGAYYRHAYQLAHLSGLYVARWLGFHWDEPDEPSDETSPAILTLGPSAPRLRSGWVSERRSPDGRFLRRDGEIECTDPATLTREPAAILDLFAFVQSAGGRLHHDTMESVSRAALRIGLRSRSDARNTAKFRDILEGPEIFRTLAAMHRTGFLGRFLPEFGACFCQAQHNRVHLYTVDVHSLYVVRELESLGHSAAAQRAAVFAEAWKRRARRGPLILAALLHDIAKAHGAAHSRVGAELAANILRRLGYDEPDVLRVQWLVAHHLLLSDIALHRDAWDPQTQEALRAVVPDRQHLDDLLALTWADMRGTNPELLTSWKQSLLEQTWRAAQHAIAAESERASVQASAARAREDRRAQVEAQLVAEVGHRRAPELVSRLFGGSLESPPGWLDRAPPEVLATHAVLLDQLDAARAHAATTPFVTHVWHRPEMGCSQWTVATLDRPGVFSMLAGTLAASGLSIVTAEALTRGDGLCIDTFFVTDRGGRLVDDAPRWRRLERLLQRIAVGEESLQRALERTRAQAPRAPKPGALGLQRALVSNDLSSVATVVEVVTPDRVGLVYDITSVFLDFGLDLRVARIATRHDLASDTFYVVDSRGRRLGKARREALREALEARFS